MPYRPGIGLHVPRPAEVLGDPVASPRDIFTVTGVVLITNIVGRVTIAMDVTLSTLQLQHSVGPTNMCAALAAIAADDVDTLYTLSGDPADLMYKLEAGVAGIGRGGFHGGLAAGAGLIAFGMLAMPGTITMLWTGDQDGAIEWQLFYLPITDDGLVVIA